MYFGEMISPSQISPLPEDTIVGGAHVALDVRRHRLRVAKVLPDSTALASVLVTDYELRDTDAALSMFAYLRKHKSRFASVKII